MSNTDRTPDDTSDELLVAYLDGQLDDADCERLEARLATDDATRGRLQTLDRVWNALDALPRSTASPAFTRSTVEMAAVTAEQPAKTRVTSTGWRPPFWLLTGGVATLLGAMLTWTLAAAPERRALRDLPVALHASALEQAGSITFLEAVAAKSGGKLEAFRTDDVTRDAAEWQKLTESPPQQRSDWVAALPAAELATVNERLAAYQTLPAVKRTRLGEFADELSAKPNANELRETALVYEAMIERLPASEQLRLRQMEIEPRLRLIERQAPKWARQRALELTDAEKQRFRRAIEEASENGGFARLVQSRLPGIPPEARDRMRDRMRKRPHLAPILVTGLVANPDRRRPPPFDRDGRLFERMTAAWRDWFDQVQVGLPERVQKRLADVDTDEQRAKLLISLLREAWASDLGATFAELPNNEIDDLLLLPKDEFAAALSDQMVGGEEPGWRGGRPGFDRPPGPPPERRRGPPR